jgi:hypothetical protein
MAGSDMVKVAWRRIYRKKNVSSSVLCSELQMHEYFLRFDIIILVNLMLVWQPKLRLKTAIGTKFYSLS